MVGNSYLFVGSEGEAKEFAHALLGRAHSPDFHEYRPEGKVAMYSIDTLRQFSREVHMQPLEGEWKVFLLHDADRMLPTSANALLKTFEEPPPGSVIILLTNRPEAILPTILSRCQKVYFPPEGQKEPPAYAESLLALLNNPPFGEIERIASEIESILEEKKKEFEAAARQELLQLDEKELTAAAREALEREVAGVYSLRFLGEVDRLLAVVLSSPIGRENLEKTLELVEEAKLKVQRFIPVSHVLESLVYKLHS
jgi:DNA polymerase-3 subunit delta'